MTGFFRHIKALLCVALAVALTACGHDGDMPQEPAEGQGLFLVCNIGMVGSTRAGTLPANEVLHSLRIMILDDQGKVESNEYFTFDNTRETYAHVTQLKSRTKKRVYLFANEESVADMKCEPADILLSGSLHDYLESVDETTPNFETKIAAVNFIPDFNKPIPLNAMYDVDIPEGVRYVEKKFWLVRAAAKFSFTFINKRKYTDITVNRFEVNSIAEREFLMPKFNNALDTALFRGKHWIDWLKDVSDKTHTDPDNPTADQSGWLTAYDIPYQEPGKLSYNTPFTIKPTPENSLQGKEITDLYCCESKNLLKGAAGVVPNEQQYTMHLECSGKFGDTDEQRTFDITLPNLRALFRNTHPHVIVTFNDSVFEVKAVVDVVPYRGCILDPYFGLPR